MKYSHEGVMLAGLLPFLAEMTVAGKMMLASESTFRDWINEDVSWYLEYKNQTPTNERMLERLNRLASRGKV
jgi:hypothetical protein